MVTMVRYNYDQWGPSQEGLVTEMSTVKTIQGDVLINLFMLRE